MPIRWDDSAARMGPAVIRILRPKAKLGSLSFVVTGTGRCGTGSAAAGLTLAGLPCGHEDVFTPAGPRSRPELVGDCSWLAVPFLDAFEGLVVHLVRDPLATAQSFLDLGFFDPAVKNRYTSFARRHVPLSGRPLDDAFNWYLAWNTAAERSASVRYRLDEIDRLVDEVSRRVLDQAPPFEVIAHARRERHNTRDEAKVRTLTATYEQISDSRLRDDVLEMASRYGF